VHAYDRHEQHWSGRAAGSIVWIHCNALLLDEVAFSYSQVALTKIILIRSLLYVNFFLFLVRSTTVSFQGDRVAPEHISYVLKLHVLKRPGQCLVTVCLLVLCDLLCIEAVLLSEPHNSRVFVEVLDSP
jgi:hypothetical protein